MRPMTSNVLVTAHLGVEKAMMPRFQPSRWSLFLVFVLMPPTWIGLGTWIGLRTGNPLIGVGLALGLLVLEGFILRVRHGQRRVVQHRDQRAMMDYSRRMRRSGIELTPEQIPVGNHLLLSGLLLTIDGMVLDIGAPAWLIERISKDRDMEAKEGASSSGLEEDAQGGTGRECPHCRANGGRNARTYLMMIAPTSSGHWDLTLTVVGRPS